MTQEAIEPVRLTAELDGIFQMTNSELEAAIESTYQKVKETGTFFSYHAILEKHLGDLCEIQKQRAGMLTMPTNA